MTVEELSRLIRHSLDHSRTVEIDGLGVFARNRLGQISFRRTNSPRIFLPSATEDRRAAERLFEALTSQGLDAWLDRRKLLPGQNWPRRIEDAIASSDFFVACFSSRSVSKRGGFQAEIRYALDCASRVPLDDVFLIPARLDECRVPARIQRETQYVDLFPDWEAGVLKILWIVEQQLARRA